MTTINLKKVICISLKSHTENQLDAIGATYNISWEFLCEMKSKGCRKLWIHKDGGYVIAGVDTDNIADVYFSPVYHPILTTKLRKAVLAIRPVNTPKMPTWAKVTNNQVKVKVVQENVEVENELENIDISELFEVELDLDTILDKISISGMSSLTKKEVEFLKNYSK